ncbi:MAG: apolipoprotein N-acyltransferase [Deltaproteobacteria bacterium]|nr:apolipoprotein N-acyltransferase [Deltaproteobacteria bacterium]
MLPTISIFAALTSGIFLTIALLGENASLFAWFAVAPLLFAIKDSDFFQSFKLGFITGIIHFLSCLYWLIYTMDYYGGVPLYQSVGILFLLSAYLALYPALFAGFASLFSLKNRFSFLFIPALWTSLEYVRGFGFSWGIIGYSQAKFLPLIQISDIFGVYGISFIIISANYFIYLIYYYTADKDSTLKKSLFSSCALTAFLLIFTLLYGVSVIDKTQNKITDAGKVKIAIVQGNIDQRIKWNKEFFNATTQKYIDMSAELKDKKNELIVWPEAALPYFLNSKEHFLNRIKRFIIYMQTDFLIGAPYSSDEDGALYNSAYLIEKNGRSAGRYDKAKLVPFGEYVPFGKWFPFIRKIAGTGEDFARGKKGKTLDWNNHKIGAQICFEIIFPNLARKIVKQDADFIINITNDTWFGDTPAPFQHFNMAVFRAIENKRAIVRCANTGISGAIYPDGSITGTTPLFTEALKEYNIPILVQKTFYTKYGDVFALLCAFISFVCIIYRIFIRLELKQNKRVTR